MADTGVAFPAVQGDAFRPVRQTAQVETLEGERVNQYTIKNELGKGAYATVYRVCNDDTHEIFAMKEIDKNKIRRKSMSFARRPPARPGPPAARGTGASPAALTAADPLEGINREVAIMKQLRHVNVLRLVEVLDNNDSEYLYMVLEFAERGAVMKIASCFDVVTPLPGDICRVYFRDFVLGLEYLHEQEIVHRDLKPENLLIAADGRLKIADFGVSQTGDRFRSGAGSPAFMAPETLGIKDASTSFSAKKADIWSAGVCLYCFAVGHVPFQSNDQLELFRLIRENEPQYPANLDPELRALIGRMLVKNPDKRTSLAEIKLDRWVTEHGKVVLPTVEEHCRSKVNLIPTEEEILNAITRISSFSAMMSALRAAKKLKGFMALKRNQTSPGPDHDVEPVESIAVSVMMTL